MTKARILVTGATGKALVARLCADDWPGRAMVLAHDARSERIRSLGAEIAVADLCDPDQLTDALRGTARAFLSPPLGLHVIQGAVAFSVAAREAYAQRTMSNGARVVGEDPVNARLLGEMNGAFAAWTRAEAEPAGQA